MAAYDGDYIRKLDSQLLSGDPELAEGIRYYAPMYIAHDPVLSVDGDIMLGLVIQDAT